MTEHRLHPTYVITSGQLFVYSCSELSYSNRFFLRLPIPMIESSAVKRKKKELELLANVIKHAISKVTYSDNDYLLHKNTLLNTKF